MQYLLFLMHKPANSCIRFIHVNLSLSMTLLGMDLGGTKLALALFDEQGKSLHREHIPLGNRGGREAGELVAGSLKMLLGSERYGEIAAAGIAVPGIYRAGTGRVWAPNIKGWEDYPLLDELHKVSRRTPVVIDSDRACYILGESWQGNAKGCSDVIYMAVGTGIGAGIIAGGNVLRGAHDIAGAVGWMALKKPYREAYDPCGCFEHYASGEGMARTAGMVLQEMEAYSGVLRDIPPGELTAREVFTAYSKNDPAAKEVIRLCVEFWGMAAANLVSLFNPEKIIFGGGLFGPAAPLIPGIRQEAAKWAQPISMQQVSFEPSALGNDAGVFGAAFLALRNAGYNHSV
jgi:glucokinase